MAGLTDFDVYLFFGIPALVGFLLNSLVLTNIVFSPSLRRKFYQQLAAQLAVANLLASGSWLLGPKRSNPQILCAAQEYIFMVGSLWQAVISLFICFIAMVSVVWRTQPPLPTLVGIQVLLLAGTLLLVAGCIFHQTAGLICSNDPDDFYSNGKWSRPFVVYVFLFMFPISLVVAVECVVGLITYRRLKLGLSGPSTGSNSRAVDINYRKQMLLFSRRLMAYPLIYIFSWSPSIASVIHSGVTKQFNVTFGFISGLIMTACSVLMGLNYFYFQQTYAPFLAPLMKCLGWKVSLPPNGSQTAKSGTEMSSAFASSHASSESDFNMSRSRHNSESPRALSTVSKPRDFYVKFTDDDDDTGFERFSLQ